MWQRRVYEIFGRLLSVMLGWVCLMGLPLVVFRPPLEPADLKSFLGVFYALLLVIGTCLSRLGGLASVMLLAFPFLIVFTAMGMHFAIDGVLAPQDRLSSLNFLVIYGVVFLAWRLGLAARPRVPDEETFM